MINTTHKNTVTERLLNTQYGKAQKAAHAISNNVIDNMYNDPFWRELMVEYAKNPKNAKNQTANIGITFSSIIKSLFKG